MPRNGSPARALVLFDIDGTLLRRAGPHHRDALIEAIRKTTGAVTTTDGVPVQGMLDQDIVTVMLRHAGFSASQIRLHVPAILLRAQQVYLRTCPDLRRKVCPGVRGVLSRIQKADIPAALVTGNLTRIAWKKMEQASLREYFLFGAFSEMGRTRAALARLAVRQARREKWIARGARISLVGDHPNDIQAAKLNGLRAVAVATGLATAEELAAAGPDLLLKDLRELRVDMLL